MALAQRAAFYLQRLARAGFSVVGIEAGPFWDTERDWVSDEKGIHELYWNDLRIIGGSDPLGARRQQQRKRRWRRFSSLGGIYTAISSFGFSCL